MIAGRDHRDAGPKQVDRDLGRDPPPRGGVFTVGDHEIDLFRLPDRREAGNDGFPPGFPDNIS